MRESGKWVLEAMRHVEVQARLLTLSSLQFEGDAVIAEVRGPEATRMASSFAHNGTAFPFILAVCNGDASSATQHKGALKHEPIKRFLDGYR